LFLKTNDRIVNLKNVSNINIIKDRNRIVFNLNYQIEISDKWNTKFISDYVYWDAINADDMKYNLKHLMDNKYFKDNFILQVDGNGFINVQEISSVKFSEKKSRVIFNLGHPVTFVDFDGRNKITSEFVYVNCENSEQYNEYTKYVMKELGV
jgi:hypothetical protein